MSYKLFLMVCVGSNLAAMEHKDNAESTPPTYKNEYAQTDSQYVTVSRLLIEHLITHIRGIPDCPLLREQLEAAGLTVHQRWVIDQSVVNTPPLQKSLLRKLLDAFKHGSSGGSELPDL